MAFWAGRNRLVNLGEDLIISIVFQINSPARTLCVTKTVAFTENSFNPGFFAFRCINERDSAISAGRDTGPTGDTVMFINVANRPGGCDRVPRENRYGTASDGGLPGWMSTTPGCNALLGDGSVEWEANTNYTAFREGNANPGEPNPGTWYYSSKIESQDFAMRDYYREQ